MIYGRLLISKARTAPTMIMATIIVAPMGTRYASAMDVGACVGTAVGSAVGSTETAVTAFEDQYESEPAKEATMVYLPGISDGETHRKL